MTAAHVSSPDIYTIFLWVIALYMGNTHEGVACEVTIYNFEIPTDLLFGDPVREFLDPGLQTQYYVIVGELYM